MWRRWHLFILKKFYKLLVIKISFVDKPNLPKYEKFKTFCSLALQSSRGTFTFVFKEDRRGRVRGLHTPNLMLSSYFVELVPPVDLDNHHNFFRDKVAVVIKIKLDRINYEALAGLLLDLYIDTFTPT